MAAARTPPRTLDKPKNRACVIAWLAEGKSATEIARLLRTKRLNVTRQAVSAFAKRHRAELDELNAKAVATITDAAIVDKAERIRRREFMYGQLEAVMRDRGPLAREPKWVAVYAAEKSPPVGKDGEPLPAKQDQDGLFLVKLGEKIIEVEHVDAALYKTADDLLNSVARELGELPRPNDAIASLHFTKITVNMGWGDEGEEPEVMDG